MIAIFYQKVPSDSKFNLLLEQSSGVQHFSSLGGGRGGGCLEKNYMN